MESLLENYDWIVDERKFFGQPNTIYDFEAQDPKEAEKRIQKLTETKNKLSKSVNVRAMNLLGSAEEQVSYLFFFTSSSLLLVILLYFLLFFFTCLLFIFSSSALPSQS